MVGIDTQIINTTLRIKKNITNKRQARGKKSETVQT